MNATGAASYVQRYGADFGWAIDDSDNSEGRDAIVGSGLFWSTPWIGVIRASDMQLVAHDGQWGFDMEQLARDLAAE